MSDTTFTALARHVLAAATLTVDLMDFLRGFEFDEQCFVAQMAQLNGLPFDLLRVAVERVRAARCRN